MNCYPVILSGGSGTRLWPLSRKHYPKQLLSLSGSGYTMLQETALRVAHLDSPIVVCNEDHRFMVAEQCQQIAVKPNAIILEPVARNTAPAIALAALKAMEQDSDAIIAVFPADHVIENQTAFEKALNIAIDAAKENNLVTFGIVPTGPETGYGYIKTTQNSETNNILSVNEFVEKPALDIAQQYVESGEYYWNSGMFVFKASAYLDALQRFAPAMVESCQKSIALAKEDLDFLRIDRERFSQCPDDSIDYAVMEKANNVELVPLDANWSDVGSWSSLWDISDKDELNNVHIGDVINIGSENTLIHNTNKLVATIGLKDVVIVDTQDALLVADKSQVQQVKSVVSTLKAHNRTEQDLHREVQRPWGSYDSIDRGSRYQVKRITVKPGASLSLQMHHHRAEHWVVVSGTATVVVGDREQLVTENQSVYIPIGETHRLTNPGKLPLELIEVQSGSYLGEDDIVRFEDVYSRL